ncbi:MAG: hypothetical protein KGI54_18265, partial [Pseudomonadota bacterium]|nr:hypothetical protein [Pseudomonadota bacterium]
VDELLQRFEMQWTTIINRFNTSLEADRVVCATMADWEYRQASLNWNLPLVATFTDDELKAVAVHELVHVLTAPIWESIPTGRTRDNLFRLNELATENVSRVLLALL